MNMLQSFAAPPAGTATGRIALLRAEMSRRGLDGFVVPKREAAPPCEERLAWLLGFTGSMGLAVVTADNAALFVDGRYVLQAREQVADKAIEHCSLTRKCIAAWLGEHLKPGQNLGYDAWAHGVDEADWLGGLCQDMGCRLRPCADNPLDALWHDRPKPPDGEVRAHLLQHAGQASGDKLAQIAGELRAQNLDAAVLDQGDSIAWLLNVRAWDAPHTPLVLSRLIVHADGGLDWFVAGNRLADDVPQHLPDGARILATDDFAEALGRLQNKRVLLDKNSAADAIRLRLQQAGAQLVFGDDPCQLPKACKNEVEQAGARAAHRRDGAALCRFLAWLDTAVAAGEPIDEIAAVRRLEGFRQAGGGLQDISFDTIAGAGPHGAIMHYRVSEASNRRLQAGELFLLDSGGQYLDGTTDVTRTIAVGEPSAEHRRHYSLVLKGHIALAQARFPEGTSGAQLDALARRPLWAAGLDYDHGTGHGVGSFLDVHEGPQRISKAGSGVDLRPGMILSNEPGFYREGEYGIRIESLVLVAPAAAIAGGEQEMLGFETLTLAPFDRRLIDIDLLDANEREFVDDYHARVRTEIAPLLEEDAERVWLEAATRPL